MNISKTYKKILYKIKSTIVGIKSKLYYLNLQKIILKYYMDNPTNDSEINNIIKKLKNTKLDSLVIPGHKMPSINSIKVYIDTENGFPYVIDNGKRLYFKKNMTKKGVKIAYNNLRIEQLEFSPHCYIDRSFRIEKEEILYDVGAAEGIFTLMNIEKIKFAVLFEADEEWVKALEKTFNPWKEKVIIVPSYVSNIDNNNTITLENFIHKNENLYPNFIKVDVEGMEENVIQGINNNTIKKGVKIALCTYHREEDYKKFCFYFKENNFSQKSSESYTLLSLDGHNPPFLRKGVIRAIKE